MMEALPKITPCSIALAVLMAIGAGIGIGAAISEWDNAAAMVLCGLWTLCCLMIAIPEAWLIHAHIKLLRERLDMEDCDQ